MGVGGLGGLDDARQPIAGVAEADVVDDRVAEDVVGLEEEGDLGAEGFEGDFAEVDAVDADVAGLGVDQAGDEAGDGMASVFVEAEDGGASAGGDGERDLGEEGLAAGAVEADVFEGDLVANGLEEAGVDGHLEFGAAVEVVFDAGGGAGGGLESVVAFDPATDGPDQRGEGGGEDQRAVEGGSGGEDGVGEHGGDQEDAGADHEAGGGVGGAFVV